MSERMAGRGPGVVAVAGEALVDFVPAGTDGVFRAVPGGSPANVAVGLARQEVPTRLLARIADDLLGHRLRAHLDGNGVDLSFAVRAAEPTSLAIVAVGPDGVVEYDFRVDGTADWQWREPELVGALEGVAGLHCGSVAMTTPPGDAVLAALVRGARETATVSYDPNCRPLLMGPPEEVRPRVEALVATADVVKVSEEDLLWLVPGALPEQTVQAWLDLGPSLVVLTQGPRGALAVGASAGTVHVPGRPVVVADTVGAGDSFMAALVWGLHRRGLLGADRRAALRGLSSDEAAAVVDAAVRASAITCGRVGADPPTAAELERTG
jgi:fructokinase